NGTAAANWGSPAASSCQTSPPPMQKPTTAIFFPGVRRWSSPIPDFRFAVNSAAAILPNAAVASAGSANFAVPP
ncbi:MAG: hypothetical protein QOD39_2861, partial [Mycobacterium sp.]|nr:hypothetical protein [Mycobacterium sp.]